MGLEALSWGASYCVFVDMNHRSTSFIRKFLREHKAEDDAAVITCGIREYIQNTDSVPDIVYIDPPYRYRRLYEWMDSFEWNTVIKADGTVFVECGEAGLLKEDWRERKYGDSCLCWKTVKDVR